MKLRQKNAIISVIISLGYYDQSHCSEYTNKKQTPVRTSNTCTLFMLFGHISCSTASITKSCIIKA